MESHLLQMRGLKLIVRPSGGMVYVASFTDAWIETRRIPRLYLLGWSHLLQMRGLKPGQSVWSCRYISRIFYRCVD